MICVRILLLVLFSRLTNCCMIGETSVSLDAVFSQQNDPSRYCFAIDGPENGNKTGACFEKSPVGSQCFFECNIGFTMIGANSSYCQPGGKWYPSEGPRCIGGSLISRPTPPAFGISTTIRTTRNPFFQTDGNNNSPGSSSFDPNY